jgi:hypothetical protein
MVVAMGDAGRRTIFRDGAFRHMNVGIHFLIEIFLKAEALGNHAGDLVVGLRFGERLDALMLREQKVVLTAKNITGDVVSSSLVLTGRMMSASRQIHAMRDPTRGGLATTLNEIASQSKVGIRIEGGEGPGARRGARRLRDAGDRPSVRGQRGQAGGDGGR